MQLRMWCHNCLSILFILHIVLGASIGKPVLRNMTNKLVEDNYRGTNFIANGWYATHSQFPYMVAIQRLEEATASIFPCGGSLISLNYIMTAAHCILGRYTSKVYVKLGAYDLSQISEYGRYEVEIPLVNLKVHESYDSETYINDIGLIKLPLPAVLTGSIQLVSLPPVALASDLSYYESRDGIVSGWGTFSAETSQTSPVLKYTIANVIASDACSSYYSSYFNFFLSHGQLCATPFLQGGQPCAGDSGGPLIELYSYPPVQIGIVSLGPNICNTYIPTIYTRVSEYLTWIGMNSDVQII